MNSGLSDGNEMVHRVRGLVVQLDLFGSEFAQLNGLHSTDVRALISLLDAERAGLQATPGWLARELSLNSASTTALIDRMMKLGLVSRARDDLDRRRVLISVTDLAKDMGWSFFGPLISNAEQAIDGFSRDQLDTIEKFLIEMNAAVQRTRDQQSVIRPNR